MEDEHKRTEEQSPLSISGIIKFLTICFVLAMYAVIFLKILFIK